MTGPEPETAMRLRALFISLVAALPAVAQADKDGFTPLFNGKDLSGWVPVNVHPKSFFVKDGEIITTGQPIGYMRSEKQYENFILEMEWMHVTKPPKPGNSGLFVWGDALPVTGSPFTRGIEVQVLVNLEYKDEKTGAVTATSHGDVFAIQGATCKPDRPHPRGWPRCLPSEYRAKGPGEWNHYRVEAKDGVIKLHVNGKEVSGVSECKPRKGYLALESEGAECHFRNIKIKELPSSNPKPNEVAEEEKGFKSLFNGLDLDGWEHYVPPGFSEDRKWKAAGGHLVAGGTNYLSTKMSYGRCELVFDWKVPAKAANPACVVSLGGHMRDVTLPKETKAGGWHRQTLTSDGGSAPIRFLPAEGLEVMNVFVRELK
jgi:3-keto-disaccharide hydrolase